MNTVLNASFRASSLIIGLLLLYGALFLYEDEQQKIQNSVENIWKKVQGASEIAVPRAAVLFQEIARIFIRGMDRVFGSRLLSLQSLAVSFWLTWASDRILNLYPPDELGQEPRGVWDVATVFGLCVPLLFSFLPALVRRKWAIWAAGVPFIATLLSGLVGSLIEPGTVLWLAALGAAMSSMILVIAADRIVLRWAANHASPLASTALVALNGTFVALFVAWMRLPAHSSPLIRIFWRLGVFGWGSLVADVLSTMSLSILFPAVIAGLLCLMAITLLLHRVFWPIVARPLYALARLVRRPAVLAAPGLALVAVGLHYPHWLGVIRGFFGP